MTILLIDNEDSFVYTLARYVELCGHQAKVIRANDFHELPDNTKGIIISPGPMAPKNIPITNQIIHDCAPILPLLGVCLGHQCIGHVYGAQVYKSAPVHGKTSDIYHDGEDLFKNIPSPCAFSRYHSLSICNLEHTALDEIARTQDGLTMAIKHKDYDCYGVQFHPESVLSEYGLTLIENFLSKCIRSV